MGNRVLGLIKLFTGSQKFDGTGEKHVTECRTCIISESYVSYLKGQLEYLQKELKSERDEYKRAVDRVLEIAGSRPVGQGQSQAITPTPPVDINKLMSLYEEHDNQGVK